jgi:hypothetical protein
MKRKIPSPHRKSNPRTPIAQPVPQISLLRSTDTSGPIIVLPTVQGKGNVPLFNSAPRREEVLGEWMYRSMRSLTSTLDGCEWSASHPDHFISRERAPGTHWIGCWVGSRAGLDAVAKRKIPSPSRNSNSDHPIFQPVVTRYTDWAVSALNLRWRISKASWLLQHVSYGD